MKILAFLNLIMAALLMALAGIFILAEMDLLIPHRIGGALLACSLLLCVDVVAVLMKAERK